MTFLKKDEQWFIQSKPTNNLYKWRHSFKSLIKVMGNKISVQKIRMEVFHCERIMHFEMYNSYQFTVY